MIKQFNFYDVYGYLLPGVALLGLLWVPIGIISRSWPEQDISKALFLAALAYFLGHITQTIATSAVPSKVMRDANKRSRFPSDHLLDPGCLVLAKEFKNRLANQILSTFGIDLHVTTESNGDDDVSRSRNTAFFQARSYLIAKKTAHYVEQFEGLYAMMRGLACALMAGTSYLAGWALAIHSDSTWLRRAFIILAGVGVSVALVSSFAALSRISRVSNTAIVILAISLQIVFLTTGFWMSVLEPSEFWRTAPQHLQLILWSCIAVSLVAASRCFSAYRMFAGNFAQSVWRDFSVYITINKAKSPADEVDSEES